MADPENFRTKEGWIEFKTYSRAEYFLGYAERLLLYLEARNIPYLLEHTPGRLTPTRAISIPKDVLCLYIKEADLDEVGKLAPRVEAELKQEFEKRGKARTRKLRKQQNLDAERQRYIETP